MQLSFEPLVAQMHFPGESLNASDRLLNAALRPDLLVATSLTARPGGSPLPELRHCPFTGLDALPSTRVDACLAADLANVRFAPKAALPAWTAVDPLASWQDLNP